MLTLVVAAVLALACAGLSTERLRRVLRSTSVDPATLLAKLKPISRENVELIKEELPEGSAERALLEGVLDAPSREHGVAELNEQSSDIAGALASFGDVPRSAMRISLAAGAFLALLRLARSMAEPGGAAWSAALGAVAAGAIGAGVSAELGRRADRIAKQRRESWNTLVQGLSRLLDGEAPKG